MSGLSMDAFNASHFLFNDQSDNTRYRILFVSHHDNAWLSALPETNYQIDTVDNIATAVLKLNDNIYFLVVLDDESLGKDIYQTVPEFKRLKPLIPILVITGMESLIHHAELMDTGVEEVLLASYPQDYLKRRLDTNLRRYKQSRAVAQRNSKLYEMTLLTGQLRIHRDPQMLIQEAIRTISQTFLLYGVGIAIPENGILRIYSGQAEGQKTSQIIQILRDPDPLEPFNRVLQTGHTEFFEDIALDLHYLALPMLPQACSAILVPLYHQMEILGVIAVFAHMEEPFSIDDIVIYDMLASQLAGTLQNAILNKAQNVHIHINQTLLAAWQTLLTAQTSDGIAQTLRQLVEALPSVDKALIWINGQETGQVDVFTNEPEGVAEKVFAEFLNNSDIDDLAQKISDGPHIVFQLGLSANDPLTPVFRVLHARQLIFMSIEDSTRLIGGILTSVSNDRQFSLEDANLVRSLSYATGQALERIMLIDVMLEKSGRLEAILRSITEGVFFVDADGKIAFCNPQLTELTGLSPSEILGQPPQVLLDLLAERAMNPETAREHFYDAIGMLQSWIGTDRSYPIVELTMRNNWQSVHVEFVAFERLATKKQSWVGIVGTSDRSVSKWETPSEASDLLLHSLHAAGVQVSSLIDHVTQNRNRYIDIEQKQVLKELQKGAENFRLLLDHYARFYNLNITESDWNSETIDLSKLVEEIIQPYFTWPKLNIHFETVVPGVEIEMNRSLIEQALMRLLENAVKYTPEFGTITIAVKDLEQQVHLSIEFLDPISLQAGEFTPFDFAQSDDPNHAWADIYLYYALTQFHSCRIWSENRGENKRAVVVSLPKTKLLPIAPPKLHDDVSPEIETSGTGAPLRSTRAVMIIAGLSPIIRVLANGLEEQDYEVLSYDVTEDAIRDISLTRVDLIVLDGNLSEEHSLDVYKQIRRRTEVPVVIVATKATNQERVAALKAGVDDYITEPISSEELLAKISVLSKRQHLADRTRPPLDLGDLRIDYARRTVWVTHTPITLTRIEYDLLRTLAINMGQVLTHQQLLEKVWGPEYRSETQYLWVNISRLRKKLEPTNHIYNQQGIGYVFQNI
jgi:DNA-binding response OmpR family regulator/PAS domain-containing protein